MCQAGISATEKKLKLPENFHYKQRLPDVIEKILKISQILFQNLNAINIHRESKRN